MTDVHALMNAYHAAMEDSVAVTPLKPRTTGSAANDEALNIVSGDRLEAYGPPEEDLYLIGRAWSAYLSNALGVYVEDLTGRQVAGMMSILKWIRDAHAEKPDNIVDAIGYALCAERCTAAGDEDAA